MDQRIFQHPSHFLKFPHERSELPRARSPESQDQAGIERYAVLMLLARFRQQIRSLNSDIWPARIREEAIDLSGQRYSFRSKETLVALFRAPETHELAIAGHVVMLCSRALESGFNLALRKGGRDWYSIRFKSEDIPQAFCNSKQEFLTHFAVSSRGDYQMEKLTDEEIRAYMQKMIAS